jgi:hypothetical protein
MNWRGYEKKRASPNRDTIRAERLRKTPKGLRIAGVTAEVRTGNLRPEAAPELYKGLRKVTRGHGDSVAWRTGFLFRSTVANICELCRDPEKVRTSIIVGSIMKTRGMSLIPSSVAPPSPVLILLFVLLRLFTACLALAVPCPILSTCSYHPS